MDLMQYLINQESETYTHETRDGRKIPLNELSTKHLKTIIKLQRRRAERGLLMVEGVIDVWGCSGDVEELFGNEALNYMNHGLYIAELKQRTYKHKTRDDKEILLSDLETSHLKNIIRSQHKNAIKGVFRKSGGGGADGDYFYDEEELFGEQALKFMNHDLYVSELNRRNIK